MSLRKKHTYRHTLTTLQGIFGYLNYSNSAISHTQHAGLTQETNVDFPFSQKDNKHAGLTQETNVDFDFSQKDNDTAEINDKLAKTTKDNSYSKGFGHYVHIGH